jgi:hypothetical protein
VIHSGNSPHWELGSEFHFAGEPVPPRLAWPQPAVWYMLARHAVAALVKMKLASRPALWLPSYFCPEVAEYCRPHCNIHEYHDLPSRPEPDWKSLDPEPQDIVLAVNYFGIRDGVPWKNWRARVPCFLLEDHSQDPFSNWATTSTADFAFASARKTMPVPDGAILWSPKGLKLPPQLHDGEWSGSDLKAAAMLYKAEYLRGGGTDLLKQRYRELQRTGEDLMRKSSISPVSPYSFACLAEGASGAWRNQRAANARHLANQLKDIEGFELLFAHWPEGAVPFTLPILFPTRQRRDACQLALQQNKIYCPVHWVCQTRNSEALDLSGRMLSLPVDQRYGEHEMDCIAEVLLGHLRHGPSEPAESGVRVS